MTEIENHQIAKINCQSYADIININVGGIQNQLQICDPADMADINTACNLLMQATAILFRVADRPSSISKL